MGSDPISLKSEAKLGPIPADAEEFAMPAKRGSDPIFEAAKLCTELACVQDGTQLPGFLQRAAKLLNASGLVLWVGDGHGRELRPAMSFGYSDQVMARMGAIARDAANATAACWRAAELRTVNGIALTSGALVVPLITPDGCIGVLCAETKGGSERDKRSQALAAIFAAQLATLISPQSSAALPHVAQA